ncbi:MAG: LamG-like jellyroll fold domain-containing protein [Solirubrobacteraceae bacterium]
MSGDAGTSTAFDGSTGYVTDPDTAALETGDAVSVEAWVKRSAINTSTNQVIASHQAGSWVLMFNPANQLVLRRSGYADLAWSWSRLTDTTSWHYVAATKAGGTIHLYIDGNDVTGAVSNQTITNNNSSLAIGESLNSAYFQGQIQEVALDNQPLNPIQVAGHYNAGAGQGPLVTPGGTGRSLGAISILGSGAPVIAAAGDIACAPNNVDFNNGTGDANGCQEAATANLMSGNQLQGQPLSAILTLGDDQYDSGTLSEFGGGYAPTWGVFKNITYPIPGNHEFNTPAAIDYYDYFNGTGNTTGVAGNAGAGYYSFDVGTWHVVALNSNCNLIPGGCGAGSPEEQWLQKDLSASTSPCTLAYWHHPLFHSGAETGGDAMSQIYSDLYAAHATLVLNGHEHQYERFAPEDPSGKFDPLHGIVEIIAGTGGRSLEGFPTVAANSLVRNNTTYGILELTLMPTSYSFKLVPASGGTFTDSGSRPCRAAPAMTVKQSSTTSAITAVGQVVPYRFAVTNAGNLALTGISLSDGKADSPPVCPADTVAACASMTCTAQHTAGQSELQAGGNLVNSATATANEAPSQTSTTSIPIQACVANPPKVNVRWHYFANGTGGGWSGPSTATCGATITMGPQAMDGTLQVAPGTTIAAGYDFTLAGNTKPFTVSFGSGKVSFAVRCVSGSAPSQSVFAITLPNKSYSVTDSNWHPSGSHTSPLTFQSSIAAPNLCAGGNLSLAQGGTFSAFTTIS